MTTNAMYRHGLLQPKILLATFGTLGDLHPFLALAHALAARGATPIIATSAMHRHLIEGEGIAFAPMRPDEPDIAAALGLDLAGVLRRMLREPHFILDEIYLRFLRETYEDVLAAAAGVDMVVTQSLLVGAHLAAECRGVPRIRVALAPIHLQSAQSPSLTRPLPYRLEPKTATARFQNRVLREVLRRRLALKLRPVHAFRAAIDLPKSDEDVFLDFGRRNTFDAVVGLWSPHFAPPQPDHPRNAAILGFPCRRSRPPRESGLDPALAAFLDGGAPPIVFTLGSFAVEHAGGFYEASLAAARSLGRRALLLTGAREVARLAALAGPDAHVSAYAPHDLLFPRAECIVHHGGIGTTAEALRAGKPQLVVPFFGDQPDHAERLRRLGVGRVLAPRAYDRRSATDALAALLKGHAGETATTLAQRLISEDGAARFADLAMSILAEAYTVANARRKTPATA